MQKLFKSECGCGMQALALICAIFPLSHSSPVMLKSYIPSPPKSDRIARLNASQTLPCEIICVLIALWVLRRALKGTCMGAFYATI